MKQFRIQLFDKRGQALLIILVLLIFVFLLGVATVIYAYTSSLFTSRARRHIRALETAESGVNLAIQNLNALSAELPEEITLPAYSSRSELINWLLSRPSSEFVAQGNFRFYLEDDGAGNKFVIGMGRDVNDWRIVRVQYKSYYFPGASPSALYVDANNVNSTYNGNAFLIDGNDHDINGNPIGGTDKPGIVTTSVASSNGIKPKKAAQQSKIRGSTSTPSITTDSTNPVNITAYTQNIGAIADYILDDGDDGVIDGKLHLDSTLMATLGLPTTLGSEEFPVIVQVNADLEILGNIEGYGIFHLNGSLLGGGGTVGWHGIFIVEGDNAWVHGTPDVIGAMWVKANNLDWRVSGNPNILYSSEAVSLFGNSGYFLDRSTWEEL